MTQINQKFKDVLVSYLGHDGNFNDLLVEFFQDQTGSNETNITDLWRTWQTQNGFGDGHFNDNMRAWFTANGLDKQYNDNLLQAFVDGLLELNQLLKEDGEQLLLEDGTSRYLLEG